MSQRRCFFEILLSAVAAAALTACAGVPSQRFDGPPVAVVAAGEPDEIATWNRVAAGLVALPPAAAGTPEERSPNYAVDLATLNVAIYDAVVAIAGGHEPFATRPASPTAGASPRAAASAAAYRVLLGLFPSQQDKLRAAYDAGIAALPADAATRAGVAVGDEVGVATLALRANDGRATPMDAYVPGTLPGRFRGTNPIGRTYPSIRPFAVTSNAQFRAPRPPALDSEAYARDLAETAALGGATSTQRTAEQTEIARFNSEPPFRFWPRNLSRFAETRASLADHARLMALLWVVHADTQNTCFESKYHHDAWRPFSAIVPAGASSDPAAAWKPFLPTPNHPEYPAAHGCVAGAMAQALRGFYGTSQVGFDIDSTVTNTTRHMASVDDFVGELTTARIAGGMHFRSSTDAGAALGRQVADWVLEHRFGAR